MKKEQKNEIVKVAAVKCQKYDDVTLDLNPRVLPLSISSPGAYWVQAWIKVPQTTAKPA